MYQNRIEIGYDLFPLPPMLVPGAPSPDRHRDMVIHKRYICHRQKWLNHAIRYVFCQEISTRSGKEMNLKGPKVKDYYRKFLAQPGAPVSLKNYDTGWAQDEKMKRLGEEKSRDLLENLLREDRKDLTAVQDLLWASRTHAVLIILQGMDTSGKDGIIRHVMSGVNPQGCSVHSFKVPTPEERNHTFLWRCSRMLPERGEIGIFNRSYYEDVLVVRVHPEIIDDLPASYGVKADGFWRGRYRDMNAFEKHQVRNGTLILKFFLHLSKGEQKKRLLARLEDENKHWKLLSRGPRGTKVLERVHPGIRGDDRGDVNHVCPLVHRSCRLQVGGTFDRRRDRRNRHQGTQALISYRDRGGTAGPDGSEEATGG